MKNNTMYVCQISKETKHKLENNLNFAQVNSCNKNKPNNNNIQTKHKIKNRINKLNLKGIIHVNKKDCVGSNKIKNIDINKKSI